MRGEKVTGRRLVPIAMCFAGLSNGFVRRWAAELATSQGEAVVTGTIVDSVTALPLSPGRVDLLGTPRFVLADGAGRFFLNGVSEGTKTIRVRSIGYLPRDLSVTVGYDTLRLGMVRLSRNRQFDSLHLVGPGAVTALPPDSVPTTVWRALHAPKNMVQSSPEWTGPFPRNVVVLMFREDASRAQRQAAVDSVRGDVVGGLPVGKGGYYYVRIADDGTPKPLFAAIAKLKMLPQVVLATPELPTIRPNH